MYIQPPHHKHTVQCIHTEKNNIRLKDSEKNKISSSREYAIKCSSSIIKQNHKILRRLERRGWRRYNVQKRVWEDVRNRREDGEEGEKQEYDDRAEGQVRKQKGTG